MKSAAAKIEINAIRNGELMEREISLLNQKLSRMKVAEMIDLGVVSETSFEDRKIEICLMEKKKVPEMIKGQLISSQDFEATIQKRFAVCKARKEATGTTEVTTQEISLKERKSTED